ncbi:MAG: acyltransferase [Bacteroides sp.]|nr:acyltransferase [Bacteroides sp.]
MVYLTKHPKACMKIGCNVTVTSDEAFNPLCRNIRASFCLERPTSLIEIGDDTGMSSPCIWVKERISIGNRVKIGGDCILMDSDAHNLDYQVRGSMERIGRISKDVFTARTALIIIGDDVLIGTRSIILKGVSIGTRSIIAVGSIVTKSIPADCVAGGNPCRVIRMLDN